MSQASSDFLSRITVPQFVAAKGKRKLAVVTAYDFPSAQIADAAGVDAILVGDSLGNVVQGKSTTLSVTLDEMIYHAAIVSRAVERALIIVDLPFPCAQISAEEAIRSSAMILQKTGADAVKIEGGKNRAATIAAVVEAGIPVMGHCGLRPQEVKMLGHFSVQRDAAQLLADCAAIEQAGVFSLVLECVPAAAAQQVTQAVRIPTIGIGAGRDCDGQVLVFHDLVGYSEPSRRVRLPKHVRAGSDVGAEMHRAITEYVAAVASGEFPDAAHSF